MPLSSAAAGTGSRPIKAVTSIRFRAEARTLPACCNNLPTLERGLLCTHCYALNGIKTGLVRTQNTSALAKCKVG